MVLSLPSRPREEAVSPIKAQAMQGIATSVTMKTKATKCRGKSIKSLVSWSNSIIELDQVIPRDQIQGRNWEQIAILSGLVIKNNSVPDLQEPSRPLHHSLLMG